MSSVPLFPTVWIGVAVAAIAVVATAHRLVRLYHEYDDAALLQGSADD